MIDPEPAHLTLAIVAINGWNRFCIAFRAPGNASARQKEVSGGDVSVLKSGPA